jgi:hypothetical protein
VIFHRLHQHIRTENWFAVLIEFTLVVLGVFIGIEVANWNQGRRDRAEERRYYAQIREDVLEDLDTLRISQERSRDNDRQAQIALAALRDTVPKGVSPADVALALHRAGFLYIPPAARRTYEELISTGNLGLLRDDELKRQIANYYARFDEVRQWDAVLREYQKEYWITTAGVLPPKVLQGSIRGKPAPVSPAELGEMLSRAKSRPKMRDLILGMAAHQERVRRDSEAAEHRALKLVAALDRRTHARPST